MNVMIKVFHIDNDNDNDSFMKIMTETATNYGKIEQ